MRHDKTPLIGAAPPVPAPHSPLAQSRPELPDGYVRRPQNVTPASAAPTHRCGRRSQRFGMSPETRQVLGNLKEPGQSEIEATHELAPAEPLGIALRRYSCRLKSRVSCPGSLQHPGRIPWTMRIQDSSSGVQLLSEDRHDWCDRTVRAMHTPGTILHPWSAAMPCPFIP